LNNRKYNKHISTHSRECPVGRVRKVWRYDLLAHGFVPTCAADFFTLHFYWHFEGCYLANGAT